jgi:UDP-glucose 4-epimerase
VDRLIERGDRVIGLDNLAYGRRENFAQHVGNSSFDFHEVDVTDADTTIALLRECDVIVHLAAHKIPRYASAMQTLKVNSEGSVNVLEAARVRTEAGNPARVVLASTSDVYGKSRDLPFREDGNILLGPSNVPRWSYATSKLFEEHLAFAYTEEYGIPAALMRFFGSYGPRHHLSWWGGPQSVFISAILDRETITIHGDGQQTRTFTYIKDTANGVLGCIDTPTEGCEVFNIGAAHGEITIVDFARLIHRMVREECPDLDIPEEPLLDFVSYESFSKHRYEDVIRRVPDVTKAKTILGVEATTTVEEGLRETIRWHRKALELSRV